jgi:hypothetical protein
MHTIADGLEHHAAVCLDGFAQNGVVARQGGGHRLRVLLPELGAAFDVGEAEGQGTLWQPGSSQVRKFPIHCGHRRAENAGRFEWWSGGALGEIGGNRGEPVERQIGGLAQIGAVQRSIALAVGFPIPATLPAALLTRGEATLGTGKSKRGGVLQPGIPGWAANRNTARGAIPTNEHSIIHAWRARATTTPFHTAWG